MRDVGEVRGIGGVGCVLGDGERHFGGKSAFDRDRVELILEVHEAVAPGVEEDFLAVGSPACDVLLGGMVGQAARDAAGSGDDEDISVAIEITGEGDQGAVGREVRKPFDASGRSEAAGVSAVAADDPEIVGVGEDDLRFAHRGKTQQERRIRLG